VFNAFLAYASGSHFPRKSNLAQLQKAQAKDNAKCPTGEVSVSLTHFTVLPVYGIAETGFSIWGRAQNRAQNRTRSNPIGPDRRFAQDSRQEICIRQSWEIMDTRGFHDVRDSRNWVFSRLGFFSTGYPFDWVSFRLGILSTGYLFDWVSFRLGIFSTGYPFDWVSFRLGIFSTGYLFDWVSFRLGIFSTGYLFD